MSSGNCITAVILALLCASQVQSFTPRIHQLTTAHHPTPTRRQRTGCVSFASRHSHTEVVSSDDVVDDDRNSIVPSSSRRNLLDKSASLFSGGVSTIAATTIASIVTSVPSPAYAKCTDIESCREEGERKIEADLKLNPIVRLSDGVRYRVLQTAASSSTEKVREGSKIDLIYSISTASGQYMYSKGFGFEKVDFGGRQESDLGLDSMRVVVGKHEVPVGIEYALVGMAKGERRRVSTLR